MGALDYLSAGKKSLQCVSTPPELVEYVKGRWRIEVDLAATEGNSVCSAWIGLDQNSLDSCWVTRLLMTTELSYLWPRPVGWLNPPFGKLDPWMQKCREESLCGAHVVALVPASIESGWFSRHVYGGPCTVHVLKGRLKFPGYKSVAGQGHMLIDWHGGEWGGIRVLDWRAE